jgi:hypothetical protein
VHVLVSTRRGRRNHSIAEAIQREDSPYQRAAGKLNRGSLATGKPQQRGAPSASIHLAGCFASRGAPGRGRLAAGLQVRSTQGLERSNPREMANRSHL